MADLSDPQRARYAAEKAALQQLLDLPAQARAAALEALAAAQPELAEVVARRLQLAQEAADPPAPAATPQPPRIARYRVLREIGHGGMGRVWLAVRADGADQQQLAIKQVRSDAADAHNLRRFEAERRALARLDHPNIAALLDAGTDADGRPYLVTPFVQGEPIQRHCQQQQLPVRARVLLLRQVAAALAHAHQQLIVHRDLKPANVLVEAAGPDGAARVRLLDFGIARLLDAQPEWTAAGASLMTLRYAAPEQLQGGAQGVGCDLYALGVLAYELLAGRSPYGNLREPAALLQAIAHTAPPPLRTAASGERIAPDLAAIVMKLLRKQPADRYLSAEALLAELDRWLAGEAVLAMRGERGYRLRLWLARRWPWLAAALVLLALLGLHLQRMDNQLQIAERERRKATEVADFMITLFQSARPAQTAGGDLSAIELFKLGSERLLDPASTLSADGRAALLVSTGHAFYQLDEQVIAGRMFAAAAQLYAVREPRPPVAHAEALRFVAMSQYADGHYQAALGTIDAAATTLEAAGETSSSEYGAALNARCVYLNSLGERARNAACYQQLLAFHRAKPTLGEDGIAALVNIASFQTVGGDPRAAEALLREAQAALPAGGALALGNELPMTLKRNLAASLRDQERYLEAAELYRQVIDEVRSYEGADSRSLIPTEVGLASSLVLAGQPDHAAEPIRHALQLTKSAWPPAHKNSLNVRLEYARWLLADGQTAAARDELLQIQALRADQQPLDQGGDALSRATLAHARCLLGEHEDALREFDAALKKLQQPAMASAPRLRQVKQWQADCVARGTANPALGK